MVHILLHFFCIQLSTGIGGLSDWFISKAVQWTCDSKSFLPKLFEPITWIINPSGVAGKLQYWWADGTTTACTFSSFLLATSWDVKGRGQEKSPFPFVKCPPEKNQPCFGLQLSGLWRATICVA